MAGCDRPGAGVRAPALAAAAPGLFIVALVAGCAAVSWPAASRLVPRNGGHPLGDGVWPGAFLGLLAVAFVTYAWAVLAATRGRLPLRVALALAVAIQLVPLAAPLLLSTDAWTYWDYARIAAVHGGNPYVDAPAAFPFDPAFARMGSSWRDTTSVYGPAFTLASEPLALVSGGSAAAAAWLYKALAAAGMVAAAVLAARLSSRPALAAVIVGWSPLLALHAAGAGHNDAWVGALLLAALAAAASRRPLLAGAGWAVVALLKWVPLVLLPLRLLASRNAEPAVRRRAIAGFAAAAAAVVALALWRYGWHWLAAFGPLARNADNETSFSLPHRLGQLGVSHRLAIASPLVALAAAAVPLVRSAARGRPRLGLASLLVILCSPLLVPWYLLWATPLAAAEDDGLAIGVALGLGAYVLAQTIPL